MYALDADCIVIGAGAAGLSAASDLTRAGRRTLVLEARDRLGGRILTHRDPRLPVPIELGAEFVHGEPKETLGIIRHHGLTTVATAERHDVYENGALGPMTGSWSRVERVLGTLHTGGADRSVAAALAPRRSRSAQAAAAYVEGFHAADIERMSVRALVRSESSDGSGSRGASRILSGYDAVIAALAAPLRGPLANVRLGVVVTGIRWRHGRVEITARSAGGQKLAPWIARSAILAVPLGVLQAPAGSAGAIRLDPEPPAWRHAAARVAMGDVFHLLLHFREIPWPNGLGFLHTPDFPISTWWTAAPVHAPLIAAWAGGPAANGLLRLDRHEAVALALDSLARVLGIGRRQLGHLLLEAHLHDWSSDPFSRGGYSYALVGGAGAFTALGRPVDRTLVIAGEATAANGQNGTVQGAIASGRRAARAVLRF